MSAPKTFEHPALGPCKAVPSVVAIRWRKPYPPDAVAAALAAQKIALATESPRAETARTKSARAGATRDPRAVHVNQSEVLSWVSGRDLSDARLKKLAAEADVEWVARVYRATQAAPGPQSYFAVNPTVLLLSATVAAAVGDLAALDASAVVNETRSRLLKGFVVYDLPQANALELLERLREKAGAQAVREGVKLETIPYLSPLCCGCGGASGSAGSARQGGKCLPAVAELIPNDTFYANQWGLQRINAPRAWPLSEGDPNVVVAVLDQGVELGHPDLNLWPVSYSTITHTYDGSPVGDHGTACAGIISARIDNGAGVAGLAGKCRVMAIATNFADVEVAEGLYFAADNGARVVSMSFGAYPSWMIWDFSLIEAALQYCQERNVLLVAATGNENQNVSRFPATDPRTLGVGGVNRDDVRKAVGDTSSEPFWGACFGPDVDVVAPCLEIPTTDRLGADGYSPTDYDPAFNGTSSATPHVAALAGLVMSVNPALSALDVRRILSATTDKVNLGGYAYLPTAGKPFGTWNVDVGYGRINAERALLAACGEGQPGKCSTPCCVDLPTPEPCCVSPCDPPWRPDEQCLVWYDSRFFRAPLGRVDNQTVAFVPARAYLEFRITYEHRLCLLGKQHGPLLFTQTLLPGEKVTLYHSERYRRITSEQDRYSVQTTFMQFLSVIHQARVTQTIDSLSDRLASSRGASSVSIGGGLAGLLGGPSGSINSEFAVVDHNMLRVGLVADSFNQSVTQASQMTHAERSVVVSTYEEKDTLAVTARLIQNDNACRAVTYFVRKVVELYAISTLVREIEYRIVAPNLPSDWHSSNDLDGLDAGLRDRVREVLRLLPKVGDVVERPRPVSLPTDGTVYDPELAHCCSCDPQREAAIVIQLEKQKAEALKACLEAEVLQIELERRRLLLRKGELAPFEAAAPAPALG